MAKKAIGVTAKEETLNQIIEAQKDKIAALTDFGKKLKKQLKEAKEDLSVKCQDIEWSYKEEIQRIESINQKVTIMAIIGSLLFGLAIGILL
jgi:hypothetical protein